ncbi:MAG: acetolactate decarboxylase, partial [Actinomycetota bacterium]
PKGRRVGIVVVILLALVLSLWLTPGCGEDGGEGKELPDRDVLYQVSTMEAVMVGVFDGDVTYAELEEHGDFGLGTFLGLDGEMVALDGEFYQVKADGEAWPVGGDAVAPFAMVTYFESDRDGRPDPGMDYDALKTYIDGMLPSDNLFYAIKVEGDFSYLEARSVPGQKKPYPPLEEVVEEQAVFEFEDVRGTMVGFRCPAYVGGINAPGYHMHFLTEERDAGGHVLELKLEDVTVSVDDTPELFMQLPRIEGFYRADLEQE